MKKNHIVRCWWSMPTVLPTWEADQEDHSSKSAWAKFERPSLKNIHHKKGLAEWLK
jgi:hypothetical protein